MTMGNRTLTKAFWHKFNQLGLKKKEWQQMMVPHPGILIQETLGER